MCAKRLATEALARGSSDSISVTVVFAFLQPVPTMERIYADRRQKYYFSIICCASDVSANKAQHEGVPGGAEKSQ